VERVKCEKILFHNRKKKKGEERERIEKKEGCSNMDLSDLHRRDSVNETVSDTRAGRVNPDLQETRRGVHELV